MVYSRNGKQKIEEFFSGCGCEYFYVIVRKSFTLPAGINLDTHYFRPIHRYFASNTHTHAVTNQFSYAH